MISRRIAARNLRVFLPFAAGYFLSYHFRVVNSVLAPNLLADLAIGPAALGLLTASYFIAFASFQLPLGVLLDRIGPRRVEGTLLLVAAAGAVIFSRSQTLAGLILGRALIGLGVSSCLMAAFKAYAVWFERERWPIINGFQMASGGLGVLAATAPVEFLLGVLDWRGVFLLLGCLTFVAAIVVFTVVPEKPDDTVAEPFREQLAGIRTVFTSSAFWRIVPLTVASQAAFLSIQGLWAGPWFTDVAGMSRQEVATMLFLLGVAMIAGWIVLGAAVQRLSRRGIGLGSCAVAGMMLFMTMQILVLTSPRAWQGPVWLAYGFFGTASIIAYTALSQSFPIRLSGRATTALNLLVFVAAFTGQWLIGAIIEMWPATESGQYADAAYRSAFGLMLLVQVAALVWYFCADRIMKNSRRTRNSQATRGERT